MSTKQKLEQSQQAEQDKITLDYEKWEARQIEANLPSPCVLWSKERAAVLQRQYTETSKSHSPEVRRREHHQIICSVCFDSDYFGDLQIHY